MDQFLYAFAAILVTVLLSGNTVDCQNVTRVLFQADEKATDESMLDISINAIPELTELTVCFHLFMLHSAPYNPIVSYFSEYDNEIVIGLKWTGQFIEFECCQARVKFIVNVPVRIRSWHHVCFSVNLKIRRYYLAYDDIVSA
ncbi:uncharacterized protein LOC135202911 [Macrobrachium nipponense]|uniref:uncharacterized protein LOC135202911 n=1 Tax=Macrobrachium nipponense TaxID=159736 RepID=UPI0030C876D2